MVENYQDVTRSPEVTKDSNFRDAAFAIQISRRFLMLLGLWRFDEFRRLSARWLLAMISMTIYYFAIYVRTIPMLTYTIIDAKVVSSRLRMICRTCYSFMAASKYVYLHYHGLGIANCMKQIETDWMEIRSRASRGTMLYYVRHGHRMTKMYAAVSLTGAFWYTMLPFFMKKRTMTNDDQNFTAIKVDAPREFWILSNFGFSRSKETPYFETLCITQVIATLMLHTIQISAYNVAVVIVMHTCGRLNILINMIRKLTEVDVDSKKCDSFNDKLSDIVKHHMRTLRFMSNGGKLLSEICFIDLGSCTIQMCFSAYFGLGHFRIKNIVGIIVCLSFFITFTWNIFSICYLGELVAQQCERVGEEVYMSDWHSLSGRQHVSLCLIIKMSQIPAVLSAGGAIPLTFVCFASVMKTSMGYLNMLRTVTE